MWWSDVLPDMESEFEEIIDSRPNQSKTWYEGVRGLRGVGGVVRGDG